MSPTPSTRVARGTPEGPGAIASLFVVGPQAWELVRQHLRCSRRLPEIPKNHETFYGWFHGTDSKLADEVVVLIHTPHKIELQGHGGKRNRDWMQEVLAQSGAEIVDWRMLLPAFEEWADPRAVEPLTRAVTDRVASILLDQANGAFLRECQLIEAAIKNGDVTLARAKIRTLAEAIPLGERLRSWKWLLAGPPNVGKSQLANALVGYERSIVSPIPGTTRDVVATPLAVGGFPVELLDTAGLRATTNALEAEGISRTRAQFAGADVVIWLLDGSAAQPEYPEESLRALAKDKLQFVINKSDLPAQSWVENYPAIPRLSARTRSGVKEWLALLEQQTPAALPLGAPVPYLPEFQQAIATLNSLMTGSNFPTEAILTTLQVCTGGSLVRS